MAEVRNQFELGDGTDFTLNDATNLFKINYYKKSENMYNSANVLFGTCKKFYNLTGRYRHVATPLSFAGGVGSGSLPTAGVATYEDAKIIPKKVYAVCDIDRETIKASADDKGAFVRATKEVVQKAVESYMRNGSRILFGDGSGALGTGDGSTQVSGAGSVADPYLVVISAATWNEANFEEQDLVNVGAETTALRISAVTVTSRQISLVGTSALLAADTGVSATSDIFYMQGSKDNDPEGLKGVLDATSSSKYGIDIQRRWQAHQKAAGGAGISSDLMNEQMLEVERKFGKAPNIIVTSYTQYRKLLNQIEDHKRYQMPPRAKNLKGIISFEGLTFMSTRGPIGVFPDRFCDADRMYFLNKDYIEVHHRPGFGWFDDDGTVFLRKSSDDAYEARYGGYYQNYIVPPAHAVIDGLAT